MAKGVQAEKKAVGSAKRKLQHWAARAQGVLTNQKLELAVWVVLVITSFQEAWSDLPDDIKGLHFGAHHGIIVFGLYRILVVLSGPLMWSQAAPVQVTDPDEVQTSDGDQAQGGGESPPAHGAEKQGSS
jgi:hypothetical protein